MANVDHQREVIHYYRSWESILGYRFLRGVKHFGYYPKDSEKLSMAAAQQLMEDQLGEKLALPTGALVLDAGCGEGHVAFSHGKEIWTGGRRYRSVRFQY